MKIKKDILIVGGTGFIGFHLAKSLIKKNWNVTSVSSKPAKKNRYLTKVNYIKCDINNQKLLKKKIKKVYPYIVNLGGYIDHTDKRKTYNSHFKGCKNIVESIKKKNIISFVQLGSSVEYGHIKSPQKEDKKSKPNLVKSTYGIAKLSATNYLLKLYNKSKFPCSILRLYIAYGPNQDINRFIPIVINACINKKKFPCSAGTQYRDFVYVEDVVRAIIKTLLNKKSNGEIINIGSGKPKKIKYLINKIKSIAKGGEPDFGKIKLRKDEILKLFPDISKAKKILKWKPQVRFESGLKKTIKYYNETSL